MRKENFVILFGIWKNTSNFTRIIVKIDEMADGGGGNGEVDRQNPPGTEDLDGKS